MMEAKEEKITQNTLIEDLSESIGRLKISFGIEDLSAWAVSRNADEKMLKDAKSLLDAIYSSNYSKRKNVIRDMSGLPKEGAENTFENFDPRHVSGPNMDALMSLKTLSFLKNGYNVILAGNNGTGKTHIAKAICNECVEHLIRTSFTTLYNLKTKIERATRNGTLPTLVSNLSAIPCLVIDEIDKCKLTHDETAVFFDIVNRKYSNRGMGSLIITSNNSPSLWGEVFQDEKLALSIMDRLFDRSYCFNFTGESYRGKNKKVASLNFASAPILPKIKQF